ncbi:MAG TPA: HAD-IC family P-type ATPase [Candidatus Paceibacterota bacterium]|nr:HAD-IC family P-type ATPase [Candidatus Paceibacterota bacterium]
MWHELSIEKTEEKLKTSRKTGLTAGEAKARREKFGGNVLAKQEKKPWWVFLLHQFKSPLVYILLVAAVLTAWLALFPHADEPGITKWVDTIVILLAVAMNVLVGFFQEFRSNSILEKLSAVIKTEALVLRGGEVHEISAEELVPGDVIFLKAGSKVPADARVIASKDLRAEEAALTGESVAVKKGTRPLSGKLLVGDRTNMVHMGTLIAAGEGRGIVVETGSKTEIGKIAALTGEAEEVLTPLQIRMKELGKIISILVGIAAVLVFVIGFLSDHSFEEMFTTAIAVAVAAIPEGLPAAVSIALAISAQRILQKKGVVKQLMAAETLGSATVICTDKTGTLTEGVMQVKELRSGDRPRALKALALSNEALLENKDGKVEIRGEATDQAKMRAFLESGGDLKTLLEDAPRAAFLPFDSERNYIASLHELPQKDVFELHLSGAPERILKLCRTFADGNTKHLIDEVKRKELQKEYENFARQGFRVIALASKRFVYDAPFSKLDLEDTEARDAVVSDLDFLGLAVIHDPLRKEVRQSIREARRAGIRTIMLTGDHILTAKTIGADLGFDTREGAIISGTELDAMNDEELEKRVDGISIYARVSPEHKMRIVGVLQERGEVVAMTGDGVNDAPALKAADIGVSMNDGTDIAKEASDLILLNNSFSVIVAAIHRGRIAFDNIRKVTVFLLSGSFTELILVLASLIFRLPLPITAVQILWTNLIEDSLPNVALAFEPGEKNVMRRPPTPKNEPVIDREAKYIIFIVGIFTDLLILALFLFLNFYTDLSLPYIQTFIFATLGLDTFFYIYSIKSLRNPIWSYNPFNNIYLVGATLLGVGAMVLAIYLPLLNTLLGTVPLAGWSWLVVAAKGLINITGIEITKWFFLRRKKRKPKQAKTLDSEQNFAIVKGNEN